MKKNAFTLAEVLITLGIIGVVAALTLPTVINNTQKKELETGLRKNYSLMQQALQKMEYDEGQPIIPADYWQTTTLSTMLYSKFMKYFSVVKDCGLATCVPAYNIQTYSAFDGSDNLAAHTKFDDGQFITNDSAIYLFENPRTQGADIYISVDVNGYKKKPNRWGYDLFTFQLMNDGRILPMGAEGTTYTNNCSATTTKTYNGISCTYSALTDPDYWKNLH